MSEKKLPVRSGILLQQNSRTEESSESSNDSHGRRQEFARLKVSLQNLIKGRDWSQQSAEHYENIAKQHELEGMDDLAQLMREKVHNDIDSIKRYNKSILKVEQRIKWLTLKYPAALAKKQNYATMKVARPPSDQE